MKKHYPYLITIGIGMVLILLTIAFQAGWVSANPFKQAERSGAPTIVNYQGHIWDGVTPFDGTGYFKFAVVDPTGTVIYWSNDGNDPPTSPVSLTVSNGLFNVNLGDTALPGMLDPLNADVFADPNTRLRVWFSPDDITYTQMPDQPIAAVPYALQAQNSELADTALMADEALHAESSTSADLLDGHDSTDFQLRVSGVCPVGQAVGAVNPDGSVICNFPPTHTLRSMGSGDVIVVDTAIAIGSDGLGVIAYYDANSHDLNVFHCNDLNCRSGTNQVVDSTGNVGLQSSIAIGVDGFPLIAYLDYTNWDLKVAHCNNLDCSISTISIPDPTGDVGEATSITIGGDGRGLISYYNRTNGNLKVAHCKNLECTSPFDITALDTVYDVGWGSSITTNTDGLGLISYYDSTNENVKLAYCGDAACTYASRMVTLTSNSRTGGTSLGIGSDGFPLILYKETINNELMILHCSNALCNLSSIYKLDAFSLGGDSAHFSLAIGRDGLGVISYYDKNYGDLKVIHCNNIHCNDYMTFALDMLGDTGAYNSIAIGKDGLPIIAYTSYTGGPDNYLMVAHCSNELCIPINWEP